MSDGSSYAGGNLHRFLQSDGNVYLEHPDADSNESGYLGHVLISGPVGFGKTTLALQMLRFWKHGESKPATCYSLEMDQHRFAAQAELVYPGEVRNRISISDHEGSSFSLLKDIFKRSSSSQDEAVVIDSLSAVEFVRESRDLLLDVLGRARIAGICIIATHEANRSLEVFETVFDTIIKLHDVTHRAYRSRHLQVAKARYCKHIEGLHPYVIKKGVGLYVYPNMYAFETQFLGEAGGKKGAGKDGENSDAPGKETAAAGQEETNKDAKGSKNNVASEEEAPQVFKPGPKCLEETHDVDGKRPQNEDQERAKAAHKRFEQFLDRTMEGNRKTILLVGPNATRKRDLLFQYLKASKGNALLVDLSEDFELPGEGSWRDKATYFPKADRDPMSEVDRKVFEACLKHAGHFELVVATNEVTSKTLYVIRNLPAETSQERLIFLIKDLLEPGPEGPIQPERFAIYDNGAYGESHRQLHSTATSEGLFYPTLASLTRQCNTLFLNVMTSSEQLKYWALAIPGTRVHLRTRAITVFGQRVITVDTEPRYNTDARTGESDAGQGDDPAPLALRDSSDKALYFDDQYLDTLVGFETGRPYRPPVVIRLAEQNDFEKSHNQHLRDYLRASLGTTRNSEQLIVEGILPDQWGYVPSAPALLGDRPREKTLVMAIDEVTESRFQDGAPSPFGGELPYRRGVLLRLVVSGGNGEPQRRLVWKPKMAVTWSCVFLDHLVAGLRRQVGCWKSKDRGEVPWCEFRISKDDSSADGESPGKMLAEALRGSTSGGFSLCDAVRSFADLVKRSGVDLGSGQGITEWKPPGIPEDQGVDMWVWYSQLAEVFSAYPWMRGKAGVCACPGGGFTNDWSVSWVKGSASARLGQLICTQLVSSEEQYNRLVRGVGLPTDKAGMDMSLFAAWPYAPRELDLAQVDALHKNANSRRGIPRYYSFAQIIVRTAKRIVWEAQHADNGRLADEVINNHLRNLASRMMPRPK